VNILLIIKIPSTKKQIPKKFQYSNFKYGLFKIIVTVQQDRKVILRELATEESLKFIYNLFL